MTFPVYISELIVACEWFDSSYLVFSENVFSPLLYYSYLGSALPAILIALFVFLKNKRDVTSRNLLLMTIFFAIWIFGALVTWATEYPAYTMFFWTLLNTAEPLVYFFAFYFAFSFIFKRDFKLREIIIFSLPVLPTLILAPTQLMLGGFDLSNCDRGATEGPLALYGYVIELLYALGILIIAGIALKREREIPVRRQILLLSVGIVAFLLSFSLGNILEVFTENWYIGQYGLFGAPLFTAILAYLIVRFQMFNIRLIATQALIAGVWLLVFSLLFVRTMENARYAILLTLLLLAILGASLIRSVKREIEAKERNEQLAKDLAKANTRLRELDKQKSEFVSIASHQLRSPLTAIRGYASMLIEGSYGKLPKQALDIAARVQESAGYMALSIEDFLNVSRIEQGRMKYELADVDLKEMARKIVEEVRSAAEKRGLTITYHALDEHSGIAHVDPGKVRQVIYNLIDNSLKYTPQGSIEVTSTVDSVLKRITISIKDTGMGMSEETLHSIFDKFVRAKNANTVNVSGTGLGLYVAKQMSEAMGGSITPASEGEGKGSTFTISFPVVS